MQLVRDFPIPIFGGSINHEDEEMEHYTPSGESDKLNQAWFDSLNNEGTNIACNAATTIIFASVLGKDAPFIKRNSFSSSEWIPGDGGYIDNVNFSTSWGDEMLWASELEGENVIHVGNVAGEETFLGHSSGDKIQTEILWFETIRSWKSITVA